MTFLYILLGMFIAVMFLIWYVRRVIKHIQIVADWYSEINPDKPFILPDNIRKSRKVLGDTIFSMTLLEVDQRR